MIQKKVCLLGASGVGKTSLVKQFVEGIFSDKYLTTIGVKIDKKVVSFESEQVQFMLWDIEGNDRYNVFQDRYLRGASSYIIVVDHTRSSSLMEGIDIHTRARQVSDCPAVLAVNKTDLYASVNWNSDDVSRYSALFDLNFCTSAKTGAQVEEMFSDLGALLLKG